jgi:hypothetical protein
MGFDHCPITRARPLLRIASGYVDVYVVSQGPENVAYVANPLISLADRNTTRSFLNTGPGR